VSVSRRGEVLYDEECIEKIKRDGERNYKRRASRAAKSVLKRWTCTKDFELRRLEDSCRELA
jgi:hypothetical protein